MKTIKQIFKLLWRKINKEKHLSFFILFLVFSLVSLNLVSDKYLVEIAKEGGEFHEIIIQEKPRFINPVLATTSIDRSLISLIYSPLLKKNKQALFLMPEPA